ncbi:MAG TPA: hypothetical protein VEP48_04815 [Methylomirabilota bacterium]|nr:hypothetical protein [Methylomirabilota bacterium]
MPRHLELLLTVAATAVAAAFFLSVPYWPKQSATNPIRLPTGAAQVATLAPSILLGPSVLANVRPAPDLNLSLPADIAVVTARRGINGETGLIPTAASITTFRLKATGDLITVAAPTGVDVVRRISNDSDPMLSVHGAYAVAKVERGNTVIRWTENGVTYEVSSRTLDASRLVELANKLRAPAGGARPLRESACDAARHGNCPQQAGMSRE